MNKTAFDRSIALLLGRAGNVPSESFFWLEVRGNHVKRPARDKLDILPSAYQYKVEYNSLVVKPKFQLVGK